MKDQNALANAGGEAPRPPRAPSDNPARRIVMEQLAAECNCAPGDFEKDENVITLPGFDDRRRKFSDRPFFFRMTTTGGNAVISADGRLHDWLHEYTKSKAGHWLFEHTGLREIDRRLALYGKELYSTHHMFLPGGDSEPPPLKTQIRWYEQEEIHPFYGSGEFPNAFAKKYTPERPDMLGVAALEQGAIIGMAGCSADTPLLWQIGIDVMPACRGRGIGTALVSLLKAEILARGKVPYYGASLSNIYSWRIALKCGFYPAWIDVTTKEW